MRFLVVMLMFCTACQFGRIPCPTLKGDKVRKHFKPSTSSLSAKANQEQEPVRQTRDKDDTRFIKNVSPEEWDCPKPGTKKYMPKAVKNNIRKNRKMIQSDQAAVGTDSLSHR